MTICRMPCVAILVSGVLALTPITPALAQSAVHYYPGKDVVLISVVETLTATTTVEDTGTEYVLGRKSTTKREGTVTLKTVADTANGKTIDLQARGLSDTSFSVELSEDGLLKNVNLSSTGRFGDILTSIAKFAGVALAVAALASATNPNPPCNGHAPEFAALPINGRFFIEQSDAGCALAKQVLNDQQLVRQRETELRTLEDQVVGAPPNEVSSLQRRIALARGNLEGALKALAARSQAFAAALTQFAEARELGAVPQGTVTRSAILQLADLPGLTTIKDGMTLVEALTALNGHPAAKDVLDRLKIAVTLESPSGTTTTAGAAGAAGGAGGSNRTVEICSRQSRPLQMRVFLFKTIVDENVAGSTAAANAKIREVSHSVEDILHPSIALSCQSFAASAFADRKLALVFDRKGRMQKIEREAKSDAAAIAAGFATAGTAFLSQASESLKSIEAIQASRRNISLGDLTTRAEQLKREKAVLDARLELEGATATFDTALKQQKLQADLNALNADIQLVSAEESRAQKAEIDKLKLALEQMQKTIELVKAEQELAKLRK